MDNPKHIGTGLNKLKNKANKVLGLAKDQIKDMNFKNIKSKGITLKNINLRIALTGLMIVCIVALSVTGYKINRIKTKAFHVYLGEDKVGTVRNEEDVVLVMNSLQKELSDTYNMEVVLKKDIEFKETNVKDDIITSSDEMKNEIKSKMSFLVQGYALEIDGAEVGALGKKEEIESLIKRVKEPYEVELEEGIKVKEIKMLENIEIVKKEMPLYKIGNEENLYNHLLTSSEEIRIHMVEVGESLWTISKIYNMPVDDLISANPDKNPEKIQIGDEIKLIIPKSMLTVATVLEVEYTERINYESEIEYNDNMYKNEKKTKIKGENGLAKIVASEIKHNGVLIEKEIIKEEIIESPIDEIIVRGTKEVPKTIATGAFLMPTRGRVSSRYGMRNGRMHRGLDIAASTGTAIKAADGGKVVFTGYKGAYGNMVEVDHGNGYKTRYAHCSKILVKTGTKVHKGQHIANVGNTGRSTGPHLHLEILKNGSNQNPGKYVN